MPRRHPYIFVLWGQRCDELAAATFVTVLRRAGLRVKVVGISGGRNAGAHGLTLIPDLSLHEALPLVSHATAFIIPCDRVTLRRLLNAPQLGLFLRRACGSQATIVIQENSLSELGDEIPANAIVYTLDDDMLRVAKEISAIIALG